MGVAAGSEHTCGNGRTYHLLTVLLASEEDQEEALGWMTRTWKAVKAESGRDLTVVWRDKRWGSQQGLLWSGHVLPAWSSGWDEPKQDGDAVCQGLLGVFKTLS